MDLVINNVINLEVDAEEIVERLTGRSTCSACGDMFHKVSRPPKSNGFCDSCGGKLERRPDDNEATIQERLKVYGQSTAPLKEFYKDQGNLKTVEAKGSVEEVFSHICQMIE